MNFEGFIRFESGGGDILAKIIRNSQVLQFSKNLCFNESLRFMKYAIGKLLKLPFQKCKLLIWGFYTKIEKNFIKVENNFQNNQLQKIEKIVYAVGLRRSIFNFFNKIIY